MLNRKVKGLLMLAVLVTVTAAVTVRAASIVGRGASAEWKAQYSTQQTKQELSRQTGPELKPESVQRPAVLADPVTGEEYSSRVIIVSVDQEMTEEMMRGLLEKYQLSVVYDYRSFSMYALSASRDLTAEEMTKLIEAVSGEAHVLNVMRDGIVHLDSAGGNSPGLTIK